MMWLLATGKHRTMEMWKSQKTDSTFPTVTRGNYEKGIDREQPLHRRRGDNNAGEAALRAAHGSSEVALTSQITIEDGL
jgi:hypothetical protein